MTSIPPAEARASFHTTHPPSHGDDQRNLASQEPGIKHQKEELSAEEDDDDIEVIDSRPVKKRKISNSFDSASISTNASSNIKAYNANQIRPIKYTSASWLSIRATCPNEDSAEQSEIPGEIPPLPARPWASNRKTDVVLEDTRPGCRVRKNVAVPTTPDSMASPSTAPKVEDKKQADYFPWTGKHQEDILSDTHVKQGYMDRAPNPPEKELNTAKATLYSAFKHRAGIDNLSALFTLVLSQKNSHGAFSSVSSFKGPPPRVTLTEAKRKSWITDLATPEVPLRRLSKTIPQGIRGQVLLDQSLLHSVPLSRAIWFAKCVGANEIRTLKRKGVTPLVAQGAEAKWLREWTINIEQFVEQNLGQCGRSTWRERIQYAIQLAARLYAENLLDRDHYLDWIVRSLTVSSLNQWPFWLMMVGMHRIDLLAFRKRARQLAETLVIKYNSVCCQTGNIFGKVIQKIRETIRICFFMRPACFLMPDRWSECEKALLECTRAEAVGEREALQRIRISNERTSGGNTSKSILQQSANERIIQVLDSAKAPFDIYDLSARLRETTQEPAELIRMSVQWAVSRYRTGKARIYLVARLFRRWSREGFDLDNALFNFLFKEAGLDTLDLAAVRHLVSELSRSRTFSTSKLIQWLTVRGFPRKGAFSEDANILILGRADGTSISVQSCHESLQVLTEICLVGVDTHIGNSRDVALSRSGFDIENERSVVEVCKSTLKQLISEALSTETQICNLPNLARLPWSMRTELSHWVRDQTAALINQSGRRSSALFQLTTPKLLSIEQFNVIRQVLELLGDIAILADILHLAAFTKDEGLLATMVDTLNRHSQELSAIGAFESLQKLYCQAYLMLRPVKTSMPLLSSALIDLCQQYPNSITPVKALQQDFVRGDRGRAIAACSPFSDGVAESLQQAGATFHDDFEAILQTESNMNEQTMTRLFNVLVDRIIKTSGGLEDTQGGTFALCQLLCRLKMCRRIHGEMLMKKWLSKLRSGRSAELSTGLVLDLLSSRCVQLETLIDIAYTVPVAGSFKHNLNHLFEIATEDRNISRTPVEKWYSAKLAICQLSKDKPGKVWETFARSTIGKQISDQGNYSLSTAVVLDSVAMTALTDSASLALSHYLTTAQGTKGEDVPARQVLALAKTAGPLSLPFCQFSLRIICRKLAANGAESDEGEIADVLCTCLEASDLSFFDSPTTFQALIQAMGPAIEAKVKGKVELTFFQSLPKFLQSKPVIQPSLADLKDSEANAASLLRRVLLLNTNSSATGQPGSVAALIEKLTVFHRYLSPISNNAGSATNVTSPTMNMSIPASVPGPTSMSIDATRSFALATLDTLHLLLQMVCVKRAAICSIPTQPSPAVAKQSQQDQVKLLGLIISIATQPVWVNLMTIDARPDQQQQVRNVVDMMFDVAATLVDEMAEDSRAFCMRVLKDKVKDERVKWLIGNTNTCGSAQYREAGHGLQLYHETKGVTGDFRPKIWEMLESGGTTSDGCLGLGLFGASKA